MITVILISAGIGAAIGGSLGFKIGRGYERVRPRRASKKDKRSK